MPSCPTDYFWLFNPRTCIQCFWMCEFVGCSSFRLVAFKVCAVVYFSKKNLASQLIKRNEACPRNFVFVICKQRTVWPLFWMNTPTPGTRLCAPAVCIVCFAALVAKFAKTFSYIQPFPNAIEKSSPPPPSNVHKKVFFLAEKFRHFRPFQAVLGHFRAFQGILGHFCHRCLVITKLSLV